MAGIPQVITEDRASGAQVIDGSLKFDSSKGYCLKRTFTSNGNQRAWTWSGWVKRGSIPTTNVAQSLMGAYSDSNNRDVIRISGEAQDRLSYQNGVSGSYQSSTTNALLRDTGWYHLVIAVDLSQAQQNTRSSIYVNGRLQSASIAHGSGRDSRINGNYLHHIGARSTDGNPSAEWDGEMSQCYFIDGLQLGPGYFGFTDPLTGTWRPKKFRAEGTTVNDGTVWSNGIPGNAHSSYPATNGFDGSTSTFVYASGTSTMTWTAPKRITGQSIEVYAYAGGGWPILEVNGQSTGAVVGGTTQQNVWVDVTDLCGGPGGVLETITAYGQNISGTDRQSGFAAVRVDGVILQDSTTQNLQFGTNGFYLPMDGNTLIGKDQSGNGNDWTPVKFGGSVDLPKATGAIPILNTNGGGTVAKGVRTDKKTYTVTASGGNYYLDGVLKPTLNAYRGGSYTFDYTGATSHPFYLSSLPDGKHNSKAYSVEFDGTGDYLGVTGNSDYDFGTGDFTIEGYFYTTNNNGTIASSQNYYSGGSNGNWLIRISSATQLAFASYDGSGNEEYTEFTARYQTNTWHHFAFVRSGTTLTCYLDGSSVGTLTVSKSLSDGSNGILIGEDSANLNPEFNGKISNFRINKGTALYTTNFTPPSTTLTNVTGTTLLCCQDSNATTGAVLPSGSTITANGNAAASNTSPFLYDTNGYYGLNLATSNTTKITIPHWAADTLYYYCNAHSGMGSSINVTTDIRKADPYAWKCVLAIPMLSKDDVSASINVNSTTKATSINGNAEARSERWDLYGGAFYFDSSNDWIQVTPTSGSTLANGTGPYTIEFFFSINSGRFTDNTYNILFTTSSGLTVAKWRSGISNKVYFESDGNATGWSVQTQENLSANTWYHFAAVRDGNTIKTYLDGVLQGTATATYTAGAETYWRIGDNGNGQSHAGYMQDLRIYNGVAKYTEDFSRVSTTPDVLPDTPSGVSGKSKLTKITDGAVYFDGSSEQHMDAGSALIDTSSNFCVEAFAYLLNNPTSSDMGMICSQYASGVPAGRMLYGFQDGYLALRINGTTVELQSAAGSVGPNSWYHTAWTWDGTTHRLFLDGKLVDSSTTVPAPYTGTNTEIGGNAALSGFDIKGYISNFRIVTGSAVYTKDFTPPTEKLTNITGTTLLCCQSNTQPGAAVVGPRVSGVNNGTGWSSSLATGSLFRSGFPGWKAFNGTTKSSTNDCAATPQTAGQGFTFTFGGGVPFTTLQMQCDPNGSGGATVKANGVDITSQLTNGSLTNTTITGVTSPLTSLSLVSRSGDAGYLGSVTIDGTMLVDPLIRNTSTIVATNFNPSTDDINAIRGQETGYATFNPLMKGANTTLSNGNLTVSSSGTTFDGWVEGTITIPKTGKWFVEFTAGSLPSSTYYGMYNVRTWNPNGFSGVGFFGLQVNSGNKLKSTGSGAYMPAASFGDVVGVMYDADNNTLGFMNNGVNYGVAFDSSDGIDYTDDHRVWWNTNGATTFSHTINFGQKPFKFPPPDGFQPLNFSTVQPEKVFARPDQYIGVTLYTGSGETVSPRTIELPHAADLVWAKSRDRSSSHQLADTVRGNNSVLRSNSNSNAQNPTTQFNGGGISIIDGKTISLVKGSTNQANNENLNATGQKGLVWSWKAGGSSNTFNIDDVGYANASDVNMNVGAFDSSTFLKGQVWSGLMSAASGSFDQAASRAFDGFLRTDPNRLRTSGNQVLVTMNLSSTPVTVSSQIKVYAEPGYNSSCTVTVGGVTHTSSTGALHTFNVSGSLTQMTLQSTQSGGRTYMEGMEIDGKLLVDDNTTVNAPSVDSTGCSVGTKQGFSIVAYNATGSNLRVSHGLSERPGFIILKSKNVSGDWLVWHQNLNGVDRFLKLNDGQAQAQADNVFLSVDSNTFGTGDDAGINSSNQQKISYIWHDVPGLQKFGKYVGNASADGTFIELGFKPAIVWTKRIDSGSNWLIHDSARDPSNPVYGTLWGNLSNIEGRSNVCIDMTSSGFKHRNADGGTANNHSGASYIYCAWAEAPTVNLYGGHANAR